MTYTRSENSDMSGVGMRLERLTVQVETQRKECKEADQHPSESSVSAFAEQALHVSPSERQSTSGTTLFLYFLQVLIPLAV